MQTKAIRVICAWCRKVISESDTTGPMTLTSHSVCAECAERIQKDHLQSMREQSEAVDKAWVKETTAFEHRMHWLGTTNGAYVAAIIAAVAVAAFCLGMAFEAWRMVP